MTTRLALALATALGLALPAFAAQDAAADKSAAVSTSNPFFQVSPLPYHYPQFDKIKDVDYAPAFDKGMAEHRAEIKTIADSLDPPTFENTIVAMEKSGQLLTRVSNVFFNIVGANTNDALEKVQTEMAPKLAAHQDAILLDGKLFARVQKLYDQRASSDLDLDAESRRLVERYYTDFVRAGAKLSDADKDKLKAYNAEIASLQTKYSQNTLKEVNAAALTVDDKAQLAGLSDNALAAAAEAAKARKLDGKYVIALQNTTGQPPLDSLTDRNLREKIFKASIARGTHGGQFDSRETIARIAKLRAERAKLLGYPNHAAYVLEDETAKTTEAVNARLAQITPPAVANARKEAADMQAVIDAEFESPHKDVRAPAKDSQNDGGKFDLAPWDWAYYAEKVRKARYDLDEAELKPYFEVDSVLQKGVFFAANKLYGLTFKERKNLPLYHPDIRTFEVFDVDGKPLAIFIADFYARESKRGGAWMNEYVSQSGLFDLKPVVANHLNIPKPPAGQPTLLTFDEVTTMFHEFGHALHGMFSNVKYPRFAGTNVPRDFVEYPSQVNEMWATWPQVLANYARHYQTGEAMPKALLDKVLAAEKFNQGFATTEYLAASLLDQSWHQKTVDELPGAEGVLDFEANALKQAGADFAPVPPRYRTGYFSHIWGGGYSSGYYAYIWSETLDADSVEWFKENGGLKRENGEHFRKTLLSRGGSEDAMQLFRDFRGRDADIRPLLERRGLTAQPATP